MLQNTYMSDKHKTTIPDLEQAHETCDGVKIAEYVNHNFKCRKKLLIFLKLLFDLCLMK